MSHNIAELTFDDADDGTGPHDGHADLDNMATDYTDLGRNGVSAKFTTDARRLAFGEGRYGRAADFPEGDGSVELTGFDGLGPGGDCPGRPFSTTAE